MTTFTWTGGSGNWDTAGDWDPLGPPTASSIATINGTTTETITVNNAEGETVIREGAQSAARPGRT